MALAVKTDPSTPDRILDAALALFNEQGASRVTTADIAAAAQMREGNLHYHFRKKEHLIEALFARFQAEELHTAEQTITNPADATAYMQYSQGWFELMWKFRCFYRDATTLFSQAPQLRPLFAATQIRARAAVTRVLTLAVEHNLMRATPEQIERLVTNVWIVSSYWMDFHAANATATNPANTGTKTLARSDLAWGFAQIAALYEPYMVIS
jgi:AcrR family transcriptional regulator